MYKYKRGISSIENAKNLEYVLSNKKNICLSMSGALDAKKPYNGMYIKDGKILLENVVEKFELKEKTYKMTRINTISSSISTDEYITNINLEKNIFEYDLDVLKYTKRVAFEDETDTMCIKYEITNNSKGSLVFTFIPLVTYRDLYKMKNSSLLKFTQRKARNGVVINLSVMDGQNLVFQSDELSYTKETSILSNVKHEYILPDLHKQLFNEDLFIPGNFQTKIKAGTTKVINVYVSTQEIDINSDLKASIFEESEKNTFNIKNTIDDNFVELKDLAISIDMFGSNTDKLIPSLPYNKDYVKLFSSKEGIASSQTLSKDIEHLIDIVRSIDGQYLTFSKVKEAKRLLVKVRNYIKLLDDINFEDYEIYKKVILLKLWYVESVNRTFQKDGEISIYEQIIEEIIYSIINLENRYEFLDDIESISLMYNALKIYMDILNFSVKQDMVVFNESEKIKSIIDNQFFIEEKNILKYSLKDEKPYASAQMVYALSLSHPCIVGNKAARVLDTIFKELYTPYGLRKISKNNINYDGNIYPKYMAYFVKANLRQNGVTRASQKIAYNLVKELLQDISKYVNGGIKKIYNDKGIAVDSIAYDLFTNAEVIRLYDMLS